MEFLWFVALVAIGYWAYGAGKNVGSRGGFRAGRRRRHR